MRLQSTRPNLGGSGVVITTSAGCMGSAPPDGRRRAPHAALVSPGASGAPPPLGFWCPGWGVAVFGVDSSTKIGHLVVACFFAGVFGARHFEPLYMGGDDYGNQSCPVKHRVF